MKQHNCAQLGGGCRGEAFLCTFSRTAHSNHQGHKLFALLCPTENGVSESSEKMPNHVLVCPCSNLTAVRCGQCSPPARWEMLHPAKHIPLVLPAPGCLGTRGVWRWEDVLFKINRRHNFPFCQYRFSRMLHLLF